MPEPETGGNQTETNSNTADSIDALRDTLLDGIERIEKRLDHHDANMHELMQKISKLQAFIDEHKAALARGLSMIGAGSKLSAWMGGGRHAVHQDRQGPVQEP